jgi:hypothetical protein
MSIVQLMLLFFLLNGNMIIRIDIYDETTTEFFPLKIKKGEILFVKGDYLGRFFLKIHPYIRCPYILICHNSDESMPKPYQKYLNDPKIIRWFAQNIENYSHPKLVHLPIGIANRYWEHGCIEVLKKAISESKKYPKEHLLYLNISIGTYPQERMKVYQLFKDVSYCFSSSSKPFEEYLLDLGKCKFVLCPRGNGCDSHRTWEALYMGAIPIVKTSSLDPIYENLPVLIIKEWEEITEDLLINAYEMLSKKSHKMEKLNADYWKQLFFKYQNL